MNRTEEYTSASTEANDVPVVNYLLNNLYTSPEYRHFVYINLVTFIISLFGVAFNIVNIAVFLRMGFKENINISLFSLAVSDLILLITLMWCCVCFNPWHAVVELPFSSFDFWTIGSWFSGAASSHTCWVTALITIERCLCVTMPLKVKLIVTPRIATAIILVSFVLNLITILPAIVEMKFQWTLDPITEKAVLGISHKRGNLQLCAFVMATVIRLSSYPCLLVATIALIMTLKRKSEWRMKMSVTSTSNLKSLSSKETKVVQMVLVLSIIVLVANSSDVILTMAGAMGISFFSKALFGWYVSQFLFSCNSSINIFFYYKMSGSYRREFQALMGTHEVGDFVRK